MERLQPRCEAESTTVVRFGESKISLSGSVRDLGLAPDLGVTMHNHISAKVRTCYFHLCSLGDRKLV